MAHPTSYYLEINGKPSCVSGVHARTSPAWSCSQGTDREHAEKERRHVLRDHPDAVVVIREGSCPAYAEALADDEDRRMAEDEYCRQRDREEAEDLDRRNEELAYAEQPLDDPE